LGCNGDHLGNVRLSYTDNNNDGVIQTDGANSEIVEESNYYPFGLKHKGYNNNISSLGNSTAQKFGYNGKELSEELGLDWLDLGARNYEATLGRFMNADPLAEDYMYQSTYAMAANNPIYYIDINGEGVETDYKLSKSGNITRVDENDGSEKNKNDTLYATDENGNVDKNNSLVINKKSSSHKTAISNLADNKKSYTSLNADDMEVTHSETTATVENKNTAFKTFKFLANNSNVEWSVVKYEMMPGSPDYQIGTYFRGDLSPTLNGYRTKGKWLGMIHSHPNEPTKKGRKESYYGDNDVGTQYLTKYGRNKPYFIYFPNTGKSFKMGLTKTVTGKRAAKPPFEIRNFKF
jgi:RHS repeat-associated protein